MPIDYSKQPRAFMCVPVRLTVFVNALLTALFSFVFLMRRHTWGVYIFGGGYTLQSRTLLFIMDVGGIIYGTIGVSSIFD